MNKANLIKQSFVELSSTNQGIEKDDYDEDDEEIKKIQHKAKSVNSSDYDEDELEKISFAELKTERKSDKKKERN